MSSDTEPILWTDDLTKHYTTEGGFIDNLLGRKQTVQAVNDISLELYPGETLGVVGESGCGKTTLGRALLRLIEPTDGSVYYRQQSDDSPSPSPSPSPGGSREEIELTGLSSSRLRDLRTDLQYIFQDPFSSLNPRLTVGDIIGEPLDIHGIADGEDRLDRIHELLDTVGLNPSHAHRYPHEFSGGQRQRIGIARALAVDPEVIICDEPVSALDVSVQAQILNLLEDLQEEFDLAYIFIAHDLSVVEHISDRIAVMYLGEFAEVGTTEEIFSEPHHPYTEALLSAIPEPDPLWEGDQIFLEGQVPSPIDPPSGCQFHTRCPRVIPPAEYDLEQPEWRSLLTFKLQVREAEEVTQLVTLTESDKDIREDQSRLSRERLDGLVRDEFGLPPELSDHAAESVLSDAISDLHERGTHACEATLEDTYVSPCETNDPVYVEHSPTHDIACLLHGDNYSQAAPEANQFGEEYDGTVVQE
ncbi:peptide ABC transporter ATPase [Natrialba chahannaoensis JCM 10990]|uniref:Peptide ABC transporter ATPase n=1 Tax=Natrialba chahannaoensis JCM 10990 TaxID=1227492 RepID=M0AUP6_9EURY|nr:oligopeptide/dipeptide ABC transporter ATP-binding protein [Natrialba chahannaoensis]ELZ01089.1 peptide ABC transporter ATPase [Natrialba chahannaoensis JCM 10990]